MTLAITERIDINNIIQKKTILVFLGITSKSSFTTEVMLSCNEIIKIKVKYKFSLKKFIPFLVERVMYDSGQQLI